MDQLKLLKDKYYFITEILDDISRDLAQYQNEIGKGDMDDIQWKQLFIDRVIASVTSYETIE
jgi:hypothetical protein